MLPLKKPGRENKPPKLFCSRRVSQYRTERAHYYIKGSIVVDEFDSGSPLDAYNIYSELGAGEFGETLMVSFNGTLMALKKTEDGEQARMGLNAELLSRCETVPLIFEAWSECDELYISMELADCNLTELAQTVGPSEEMAWALLADVGKAIIEVHRAGYYHLDVKMDNILIKNVSKSDADTEIEELESANLEDGPPMTSRYKAPLDRMGLSRTTLVENVAFLLSDFGNACNNECVHASLGDSRYCQHDFIESHVPSSECDGYALGVTIFELCTQVELPVEGDLFALFRVDPFNLIENWSFSEELATAVRDLLEGMDISKVLVRHTEKLNSRAQVYENISDCRGSCHFQFVRVFRRKERGRLPKDLTLVKACRVVKRKKMQTESSLEDFFVEGPDEYDIPENAFPPSELLAGGLELSF